jgi:acetyltransferase-like isoleucine patch superfamily enzyme
MQIVEEFPGANDIRMAPGVIETIDGAIEVRGRNNTVIMGMPQHSGGFYAQLTGDAYLSIGEGAVLNQQSFLIVAPARLTIGAGTAWSGPATITMHEPSEISIGANCLIAGGARISTSHVHKIYDKTTRDHLNKARNVKIGDRVWLGAEVKVFPGADIGHDSVVGMGAYVSKAYPPHCLLVGTPAVVKRDNIVWEP